MKELFGLLLLVLISIEAKAETITWGNYNGNKVSDLEGVGMNKAASYSVASFVPGDGALGGSTLEALNVPVFSKYNMKDITVWVADIDMNILSQVEVSADELTNDAFTQLALEQAVTVPAEGLYMGSSYTITEIWANADMYPICCYKAATDTPKGLLLKESNSWRDYTSQFGSYGIQGVFSGVNLVDVSVVPQSLEDIYTTPGKEYEFLVNVVSSGTEDVENVEYSIDFNGQTTIGSALLEVGSGFRQKGAFKAIVTGPDEIGDYPLSLTITKVNGKDNEQASVSIETIVKNVERIAIHRTVVEEYTGTSCGYCPRGLMGMKLLREKYGDRFVGIGLHQYNTNDPMYIKPSNYANLSISSAPSCLIDRSGNSIDPYFGVFDSFENANSVIAPVDVELTATWVEGTDFENSDILVDLKATILALVAGKYNIEFVLTADSLRGSKSSWKQSNYYYTSNPTGNDLDIFCRGGSYGKGSFYWDFDDVALASSYKSNKNQAEALGQMEVGESVESSFTLALPTKKDLLDAVKKSIDKVYGIVIIVDAKTKKIVNANRVKVVSAQSGGAGIEGVAAEARQTAPAGRYSLDGKRVAEGQKGICILRMNDGTVRKELR